MVSRIPIADIAARLDDLLDRVKAGEEFLVHRGGEDVCRIGPVESHPLTGERLVELLRALPRPDDAYLDDVERAARDQPELPASPWES
jgi:antitoxin (DNA-binding transcriptional repressor) of toxin-antitoxin stability system